MRAVEFDIEGRTLVNRKETFSKRDQVAQLILIQISIVDKDLWSISSQY